MPGLGDLPPPEEGATEGYYPDPLGGEYPRWWDGTQWTNRVGPKPTPPLAPGESELVPRRPRKLGAIFGSAFRLYGRFPVLFLVLAAGVVLPYDLIVRAAIGWGPYTGAHTSTEAQIILAFTGWILLAPLVSALHVHAAADVRQGQEPELGAVAMRGIRVLPVVVAAAIMSGLGIALGLLVLIVPGVILYFRWFVVAQVAAIDNEGWLEALRGSRQLTAGRYLDIFFFVLCLGLILLVPTQAIVLAFGPHDTGVAAFVLGLALHVLAASLTALTTALFYYDLVARRQAGG
jgi:hypothetical protein